MLIDTHAHLQDNTYKDDFDLMMDRARENHVRTIITIGTDIADCQKGILLTHEYPDIFATVGIHPNEVTQWNDETEGILRNLAKNLKVVAIGEIGLDFHYSPGPGARQDQQMLFRRQIAIARDLKLPLMIHIRDAHHEARFILKEEKAGVLGGVIHCFSGDWDTAEKYLEMGFCISFGGIVTFGRKSAELQEVAKRIPADRIVLETDCPWLAPEPYRGKRNEPAYVAHVADKMAELRGITRQEIADLTTKNANRIFEFVQTPNREKTTI